MKRGLAGSAVLIALFAAVLWSQNRASVFGTITDPSAAIVADAAVELRSVNTGALYNTRSNEQGVYRFDNLPLGEYELTVTFPGFKTYTEPSIVLGANGERRRVDVALQLGAASEAVIVTDAAPLLKTETGEVAGGQAGQRAAAEPLRDRAQAPFRQGRDQVTRLVPAPPPPAPEPVPGFYGRTRPDYPIDDRSGYRPPRPRPSNEQYGHWVENEFTSPGDEPLSTFAVDVDTASYSNIRRFLNDGQLPPPDSVRIEELINYFTYDYPAPDRGKPVSLTSRVTRSPWNPQRQLLVLGMRTTPIAQEDLPPSNLTFLVDVSGSMSPANKLPLVQQSLKMLARQLRPEDHVSLVVYAGNSGVVLPPTAGDRTATILDAIDRLRAGGSTHGSAGIRLAYEMARRSFNPKGNNRVILATDGDFNVGISSDEELVRLIERERASGVFLSVLGFGTGNLKDSKMEKLADHGNGNYAYIDSFSEARKVFVEQMGATLVTVAKDVKLQIEFNPARVKAYRLIGYENRLLNPEDFNDDTKDAGDLGAGHQVTAMYEIIPAGSAEGVRSVDGLRYQDRQETAEPRGRRTGELAWVKLRHKAPQSGSSELLEWPVSGKVEAFERASREVRFAAAVAEYGLLLRESRFAGQASYQHALETASDAIGPDLNGHRSEFLDLIRQAAALSANQYSRR